MCLYFNKPQNKNQNIGFVLGCIRLYQRYISPSLHARCRYYPTCSAYAYYAFSWHGLIKGGFLTFKRLLRCQPWGGSGIDFVPLPLARFNYQPSHNKCYPWVDKNSYRVCLTYLMRH